MSKIFIGGSRSIKKLPKNAIQILEKIQQNNHDILIGDAQGVDAAVQNFFAQKKYHPEKINIFVASKNDIRNNAGNWKINRIHSDATDKFEIQRIKDLEMAKLCDSGFMIWSPFYKNRFGKNSLSKGTLYNSIEILKLNKEVVVLLIDTNKDSEKLYHFKDLINFNEFINNKINSDMAKKIVNDNLKSTQERLF